MPNGRIHDHPYSDIVDHHVPVFSLELDTLIAEIAAVSSLLQKESAISDDLSWQMLQVDRFPHDGRRNADAEVLRDPLIAVRDELVAEAGARGLAADDALQRARWTTAEAWRT